MRERVYVCVRVKEVLHTKKDVLCGCRGCDLDVDRLTEDGVAGFTEANCCECCERQETENIC